MLCSVVVASRCLTGILHIEYTRSQWRASSVMARVRRAVALASRERQSERVLYNRSSPTTLSECKVDGQPLRA